MVYISYRQLLLSLFAFLSLETGCEKLEKADCDEMFSWSEQNVPRLSTLVRLVCHRASGDCLH